MLLSIASKMYNEEIINKEQRGIFKELILSNEQALVNFLNQYENNEDYLLLYYNIVKFIEDIQNSTILRKNQ